MLNAKEERRDKLLGGFVIILIGVLLSSSSLWGLVNNSYLMTSEAALVFFLVLGIGAIIYGGITLFSNIH